MTWYTGTVCQISSAVESETTVDKGLIHCKTVTRSETVYSFVVKLEDGRMMPLSSTASREKQLPLMLEGDVITFARARGSYGMMFSQLTIDFSKRNNSPAA